MAQAKRRAGENGPRLDMTPMIDVVFQLLIFFVVTLKQEDIMSKLTAARPRGEQGGVTQLHLIDVSIRSSGFTCNGRAVSLGELDGMIGRFATFSQQATVVLTCDSDSPHGALVQALDVCQRHGMANVSVFSR